MGFYVCPWLVYKSLYFCSYIGREVKEMNEVTLVTMVSVIPKRNMKEDANMVSLVNNKFLKMVNDKNIFDFNTDDLKI